MAKKLFEKGNPGRKKGARNKKTIEIEELRRAFINAIYCDEATFRKAFKQAMQDKPIDALKVVASVLPRDTNVNIPGSGVIIISSPEEKDV